MQRYIDKKLNQAEAVLKWGQTGDFLLAKDELLGQSSTMPLNFIKVANA